MTKVRVRKEYQGLSPQDLINRAYKLGFDFEKYSQSCSQSTMAALHEIFEIDKVVVKVCTSLAGGSTIQMLGTCGALAGGIIAIDYVYGRPVEELSHQPDIPADPNSVFLSAEVSGLLADRFVKRYGTIICSHIHRQLMGRTFWVRDQEDYQKLEAAGAHIDSDKCCDVVGNVASWVMEILLEKGGIKL